MLRFILFLSNIRSLPFLFSRDPLDRSGHYELPSDKEQQFAAYYKSHIQPAIIEFEALRLQALKTIAFRSTLFAVVLIVSAIMQLFWIIPDNGGFSTETQKFSLFAMAAALMGIGYWAGAPARNYGLSVKKQIFPIVFRFLGDRFHYQTDSPIQSQTLIPFGLLPPHDISHYEDYIAGIHGETILSVTEATLKRRVRTQKTTREVQVFHGLFILFEIKKPFLGKTLIKKDSGSLGNWLTDKFNKLESIKLEDPRFEKIFEVYSTDQIEARYILTPSFMERLIDLSSLFKNKIECSFLDRQILLKIPCSQNKFEVSSIFQTINFENDALHIIKEMHIIFDIIDTLKLNHDTGI